MSVYHQVGCSSKEGALTTRTGGEEGIPGLEKVSLCLPRLKTGKTEKRIEKLFKKY